MGSTKQICSQFRFSRISWKCEICAYEFIDKFMYASADSKAFSYRLTYLWWELLDRFMPLRCCSRFSCQLSVMITTKYSAWPMSMLLILSVSNARLLCNIFIHCAYRRTFATGSWGIRFQIYNSLRVFVLYVCTFEKKWHANK